MLHNLTLAHFVRMDTIGGVERSFSQFIGYRLPDIALEHHTILTKRKIAGELQAQIIDHSKTVFSLKHAGMIPIPRAPSFLRSFHLRNKLRTMSPDAVLFWSIPKHLDAIDKWIYKGPIIYYERGASWLKEPKESAYMNRLMGKVDGIICNSNASKRVVELKWHLPSHVKVSVAPNAVRPDCFPENLQGRRGLGEKLVRLGVAGRLINQKGIALAIQALAKVRKCVQAELWIAGTGPEKQNLQSLAQELGLEKHTRFLDLVSDMREFYKNIDILICPSMRESFGLVCAEAMVFGCPVIGSRVDGLPEVISHGETGFCLDPSIPVSRYTEMGGHKEKLPTLVYDPANDTLSEPKLIDPDVIAEKVISLVNDKGLYERMSRACIELAIKKFSFERHVRDVVSCILNII